MNVTDRSSRAFDQKTGKYDEKVASSLDNKPEKIMLLTKFPEPNETDLKLTTMQERIKRLENYLDQKERLTPQRSKNVSPLSHKVNTRQLSSGIELKPLETANEAKEKDLDPPDSLPFLNKL